MKTSWFALIAVALCLVLSSCEVISPNPLSSPAHAVADAQLVGDWHGQMDNSGAGTFRFIAKKNGWMHVDILPDKTGDKTQAYDFFVSIVGKNHFLNVVQTGTDDAGHPTKAYTFVRYDVSGDHTLHLWLMSQDQAAADVRAGKIKGHVQTNSFTSGKPPHPDVDVALTDSMSNLNKYVQDSDLDKLFTPQMKPFHRVAGSK